MTNLGNDIKILKILEQIKQMNEDASIEIIDNVITVTNGNPDLIMYLLLLFGKVKTINN